MKFLIITCVATYLNFVQGESCSTPNRSPGNCISIYNCEPLLTLARSKTRTQADVEFMRSSHCGFEGQTPKVCCPLADQPSNDFCFTPDSQEGRCVQQNSCQHLTSLANNEENRAFIHNSKCGENRVCCGNQPPNLGPAHNRQYQSIAPQYPRCGCCGVESNPGDRIVESCSTPGRSPGNCISIYNCEPLLTLARSKTRTQADVEFIRNSQCGYYERKNPKVCCPLADQPSNDFCFTPDAQEGRCVEQNSCQHLTSLANNEENRAFIHNSKCGENRVCCGNQPPNLGPAHNGQCQSIAPQYPRSGCCGVESNPGDRIFGGEDASIFEYPWMALIEYATRRGETKLWCGGSLISSRYVLTAGHCVVEPVLKSGTPRSVRLGEHDTSNALTTQDCQRRPGGGQACNDGAISIPIEKIIAHENYDAYHNLKRDDIALLRLKEMAPLTLYIKPICLPQVDVTLSNPPDLRFFVAGWGAVNETHSKSNIKQYVDVPYITKEGCQPSYSVSRRNVRLWEGQICAGGEPNKDSCKGDSGGPLMYKKATKRYHEVIGVVSFGPIPCGIKDVPGVYTKVYNYLPWIRKNIVP